jgi:hypothetical protein
MSTTTRQVAGIAVLVALIAGLLGYWLGGVGDGNKASAFSDKWGRACTQVSTGLDCDYPPLFRGNA